MHLYSHLATVALLLIALAVAAGLVGLGTITTLVATNRRIRHARHESLRTYYRGLVLSH